MLLMTLQQAAWREAIVADLRLSSAGAECSHPLAQEDMGNRVKSLWAELGVL